MDSGEPENLGGATASAIEYVIWIVGGGNSVAVYIADPADRADPETPVEGHPFEKVRTKVEGQELYLSGVLFGNPDPDAMPDSILPGLSAALERVSIPQRWRQAISDYAAVAYLSIRWQIRVGRRPRWDLESTDPQAA